MSSRFFLSRPLLVLLLLAGILVAGGFVVLMLMVRQYLLTPLPTLEVSAVYPGASAQVLAHTVAAPIEEEIYGVEDMVSMSRQSGDDGAYRLTITFRRGTDLNLAQVLVQNRVSLALPRLPEVVQRAGLTVTKQTTR